MASFEQTLSAYLARKINFAELRDEYARLLGTEDAASAKQLLEEAYRSRRLPGPVYAMLRNVKAAPAGQPAATSTTQEAEGEHPHQDQQHAGETSGAASAASPRPADDPASGAAHTTMRIRTGPRTQAGAADVQASAPDSPRTQADATGGSEVTGRSRTGGRTASEGTKVRRQGERRGRGPAQVTVTLGDVLKERFVLEEKLGEGGMGAVFKARDLAADRISHDPFVAIKVLSPAFAAYADSVKQIREEFEKLKGLSHDNIVRAHDFDEHRTPAGSVYFISMELLRGRSLHEVISLNSEGQAYDAIVPILEQLVRGLSYAHAKGVVHSDLKPSNVFIQERTNTVKILDFGIARRAREARRAEDRTMTVVGGKSFDTNTLGALTEAYASYEMFTEEDASLKDDVYALAVIVYELLTGRHPFNRLGALEAVNRALKPKRAPKLSRRQWRALEHGLALKADHRTGSVERFYEELSGQRAGLRPLLLAAGIVVTLAIIGVAGIAPIRNYFEERDRVALTTALSAPDHATVLQAWETIEAMELKQQRAFLAEPEVRDPIIAHVQGIVDGFASDSPQALTFAAASEFIGRTRKLAPLDKDSDLLQLETTLAQKNADALRSARQTVNRLREERKLLDVRAILEGVARIDPTNSLLTDGRLVNAFQDEARAAIEARELDYAARLLTEAQTLGFSDQNFTQLTALLRDARREVAVATEVARLEDTLRGAVLEDLSGAAALREPWQRLRAIAPDSAVLATKAQRLAELARDQLNALLGQRRWSEAGATLASVADLLPSEEAGNLNAQIQASELAFQSTIKRLRADLERAVAQDRLDATAEDGAYAFLRQLEQLDPSHAYAVQGRDAIAERHLQRARELRDAGRFPQAQAEVARGEALKPSGQILGSLAQTRETIQTAEGAAADEAERHARAEEAQKRLAQARADLETYLRDMPLSAAGARAALERLDALAQLDPIDPAATGGREAIAGRFVDEATRRADAGDLESGIALLTEVDDVMTTSASLRTALDALQERHRLAEVAAQEARHEAVRAKAAQVLAAGWSPEWEAQVEQTRREVEALFGADADEAVAFRASAAQGYLGRTQELLEAGNFKGARQAAERAQALGQARLDVDFDALAMKIDAEEMRDRERQDREAKVAKIEGLKQDVRTFARANDLQATQKALDDLRAVAPPDDPFIATDGLRLLAGVYLHRAEKEATRGRYDRAMAVLEEAIKASADFPDVRERMASYESERRVVNLEGRLQAASATEIPRLAAQIEEVFADKRQDSRKLALRWEKLLADRVESTGEKTPDAAQALLDAARQLFPASAMLRDLQIAPKPPEFAYAKDASRLLSQGKLNELSALLDKAATEMPKAKELGDWRAKLDARKTRAASAYEAYRKAFGKDWDEAQKQIEEARSLWSDNSTITSEAGKISKARREQTKPSPEPQQAGRQDACGSLPPGRGRSCADTLASGSRGPSLVVVPKGGGQSRPFAIGQTEVTVEEFSLYCRTSGECAGISGAKARHPVTQVSVTQAIAYTRWLTQQTGYTYRLPTTREWQFAADAGGRPSADYNCTAYAGGNQIKGHAVVDVRSGGKNGWGLVGTIGNTQEWTVNGGRYEALGGAFSDRYDECSVTLSRSHSGNPDGKTGFRVLRQIDG